MHPSWQCILYPATSLVSLSSLVGHQVLPADFIHSMVMQITNSSPSDLPSTKISIMFLALSTLVSVEPDTLWTQCYSCVDWLNHGGEKLCH